MKSFRVLALSILSFIFVIVLAACGGGGSTPKPPAAPLTITTALLARGSVNVPYSFLLQGSGGTGTYTWAITKGTLPTKLTFSDAHGQISGTPNVAGVFPLTFQVTDGAGNVATADLPLNIAGAVLISCSSCAGSSLPYGNPGTAYSATLTASGGVAPYTWCAVETDGTCDNGSQGALPPGLTIATSNNTGVISGTPTVPGTPATVTIQVSDSETPVSHATEMFTLTIFDFEPKVLPNGSVDTPYSQTLAALGGTGPFTFTLSGSLPPGLHLGNCVRSHSPTCLISGTPTQGGTTVFSMQVQDGETPPASETANVTITIGPAITNGNLKGNYVFTFTGYNNSSQVLMAGAFAADGNGNITGGELDLNDGTGEVNVSCPHAVGTGPQQQTIGAGSVYSIDQTGTGTLTLVTNTGTYNFHIAIKPDGSGSLIQDNTDPNTRGSGVIKVQRTGIGTAQLEGLFALGITGSDSNGNRYAAAGEYTLLNPNGDLSGPYLLDVNDAGTVTQPTWQGTLSTTIDSFGRGCFGNFRFSYHTGNQHYNYSYYIVSSNELVLLETDPVGGAIAAPLAIWSTLRQVVGNQFDNTYLQGPTVIAMSGRDTNGAADVLTGLFTGTTVAGNTCQGNNFDPATVSFDQNQGGTVQLLQQMQGTYCVDKVTGRVTLTGFNGEWQNTPPVFYVGGNDPGFIVSTDTAVSTGSLYRPTISNFSNASVSGLYAGGTYLPMVPVATDSVATLYADGAGNISGPQFISGPGGPAGPNVLALTYSVDSTGRAVVQNSGQDYGYMYVVGPTQFIMLPVGNNPVLNIYTTPTPN